MPDHGVYTLSGSVAEVETRAEEELLLVRYASANNRDAWNELTDETIIDRFAQLALHPPVGEDDFEWPARDVWSEAYRLACKMRDEGVPVPSNIVPNGEGGIVFEWRHGPFFDAVEFGKDRSLEFRRFKSAKLVLRDRLTLT
ncbi:MAG: hypothetical protein ABSF26_03490 [Thermoguttaceae bacterium]|jgi:hypothetical protein